MTIQSNQRIIGLDLLRFLAAFIVSMGHLLFLESPIRYWTLQQPFLFPLRLGLFSVFVFFVLSGFVLAPQLVDARRYPHKWIKSRLIRLLPLYWFSWIIPLLFITSLNLSDIHSYYLPQDRASYILGFFASQSWTNSYYIDGPNTPLWSLSVEVGFSFFFIVFAFLNRRLIGILMCFLFLILWRHPNVLVPVTRSLPYFLLGMVLHFFFIYRGYKAKPRTKLIFGFLLLIGIFPTCYGFLNTPWILWVNVALPLALFLLVLNFLWLRINNKRLHALCSHLGSRTFSLYVVHWPVLMVINNSLFKNSKPAPLIYILFSTLIILLCTELTYRIIEAPSLRLSRKIRNA